MTYISTFELLKIGVRPSSSHTLGPWKAALKWREAIPFDSLYKIKVHLYGSLALTGKGHCTDKALILGLLGCHPETITLNDVWTKSAHVNEEGKIGAVAFSPQNDIHYHTNESLPFHSNGLTFIGYSSGHEFKSTFYSIGGGFILQEGEEEVSTEEIDIPYSYETAKELEDLCESLHCTIADVVIVNEKALQPENEVYKQLLKIWEVMKESAYTGCHTEGILPGGLNVKRRAFDLNKELLRDHAYHSAEEWIAAMQKGKREFKRVITRVSCLAMAVNEQNAAMGRVVTAPTNGSAGVIPAVLFYFICFSGHEVTNREITRFLLTASEIGKFFKKGATISAAAGGCQAEIGVSSSMAAAALTEGLGGSPAQSLMAAEIAMEHHLGLTCDPVKGLVQIPCIERNSMGAIKAINASMMALVSDPANAKVSLDEVIVTMNDTAKDMNHKYKETSQGGLAVNVGVNLPEC